MTLEKTTQNVNVAESLKDIGGRLQIIRLEQELELEAVFQTTKIPIKYLKALEAGDLDSLPELVYVKGFIRRYAQRLQQDVESFALGESQPSLPSKNKLQLVRQIKIGSLFQKLKYPLYAIVVVSIGSGLVYLNDREFSPAPVNSAVDIPVVSQSTP